MSADNRTVATDALETLGLIHFKPEHRDAIHLAVEAVEAGEVISPGSDIGIAMNGKAYEAGMSRRIDDLVQNVKALGIADPFLKKPVEEGNRFWLVVYPRQIKSLRHVWEHPDFPPSK